MLRKVITDSIERHLNSDQIFENEALAVYVEDQITNKLSSILTEQEIQKLEKLGSSETFDYLGRIVPKFDEMIKGEVQKAKERFKTTKQSGF